MCGTGVGLVLLPRPGGLGAVLRLHLDQVGSLLLAVEGGSSGDDAAARVDAEVLRVSALVLQDRIVDLGRRGGMRRAGGEEEDRNR